MATERLPLIAYEVVDNVGQAIERASHRRDWMDQSPEQFAYRCLPLVIANQSGWVIRCPVSFSAMWSGGPALTDVCIIPQLGARGFAGWEAGQCVRSHFGEGVLTFTIPYLFRTAPGYNLWVKGPANLPKDGIQPLEGVVETDWAYATFTMNWKFTRPQHIVQFDAGEPICQILPYPRGLLESTDPEIRSMAADRELAQAYQNWRDGRRDFITDLNVPGSEAQRRGWEKKYTQGLTAEGTDVPDHQTRLRLRDFKRGS
jgi:hypothetical protein